MGKPSPIDIELFTTTGAAHYAKCSADTIRRLERAGQLKSLRTTGGVRLFTRGALERLAAARQARRRKGEK